MSLFPRNSRNILQKYISERRFYFYLFTILIILFTHLLFLTYIYKQKRKSILKKFTNEFF